MARDARPEQLPARDCGAMSFADFICHASGGNIDPPWHLGRYFDLMGTLAGGNLRLCVSMPPQHGKSTVCHYAIAHALLKNPRLMFGFGSYAKLFANDQTQKIRDIYIACGGRMKADHNRKDNWRTEQDGGCIACSPESALTGYRIDVLIIDDIVRDAAAIEDERARDQIWDWMHGVAFQRTWVDTSIVVIGTRWHPDDPIGRLIAKGFDEINLPAIREDADGTECALWPDVKPLEWLNTKRLPSSRDFIGDHEWATQYQGKPVPREGAVFGAPRWYDELPAGSTFPVIGFDFGYGPEGSSDYSVAVVMAYRDGLYYVHDVRRVRTTLAVMAEEFKSLMREHPPPTRYGCYMGGNEKGILNQLFQNEVAIERMPARHNKWTRAQRAAVAWRAGRILVRKGQPWSMRFAREVEYFTGNERGHDDQVDALVAAFDLVEMNSPIGWAGSGFTFGSAVM